MNIKKYTARSEKEAMDLVKQDLGLDAVILNIKRIEPKGIRKIFMKPSVEVLAAVHDSIPDHLVATKKETPTEQQPQSAEREQRLEEKLDRLEHMMTEKFTDVQKTVKSDDNNNISKYKNEVVEMLYNHLIAQEVDEELALLLLKGIDSRDINVVVSQVYKRIVHLLGTPEGIQPSEAPQSIMFLGTTGVGKTTTIAKLAANLIIKQQQEVGLVTTDTYRIAAVEQLKTYSKILNIPMKVAYSPAELRQAVKKYEDENKQLVLIDTAGASQKNDEQFTEIVNMINSSSDMELYVVLSMTTKYRDMVEIIERYNYLGNIKVIFSKLDETNQLGNILNLKSRYNIKLSYMTTGQNVPDDLDLIDTQYIARLILGGDYSA